MASSAHSVMKQFSVGCSRAARSSTDRITSTGEISRVAIAWRSRTAGKKQSSSFMWDEIGTRPRPGQCSALYARAREALALAHEGFEAARAVASGRRGRMTVGYMFSLGY